MFRFQKVLQILLTLLSLNTLVVAQTSSFPLGVYCTNSSDTAYTNSNNYQQISNMGANYIIQIAEDYNRSVINQYANLNLIASNYRDVPNSHHYIPWYTSGYYKKWKATGENQTLPYSAGSNAYYEMKPANWATTDNSTNIVRSGTNISNKNKRMLHGPNTFQEMKYNMAFDQTPITYTVRFHLKRGDSAIESGVTENSDLCKISVTFTDNNTPNPSTNTIVSKILQVKDVATTFTSNNSTLDYAYSPQISVNYPNQPGLARPIDQISLDEIFVQFEIQWLGSYELFVDYVEVYDNLVWPDYINSQSVFQTNVTDYANTNYSTSKYPSLKYWYSRDEPVAIESFAPFKIVNSLLTGNRKAITAFFPLNCFNNFDGSMFHNFRQLTDQDQIIFDFYPINRQVSNHQDIFNIYCQFDIIRDLCKNANTYYPGFYYATQGFESLSEGFKMPTTTELNAMVMLGLGYGSKGIFLYNYYSDGAQTVGLVNTGYQPSELWNHIHDNIAPRLSGVLGTTLLSLSYLNSAKVCKVDNTNDPSKSILIPASTSEYLTLELTNTTQQASFDGCMFNNTNGEKNFMLINSLTYNANSNNTVKVKITDPSYTNWKIQNYEGGSVFSCSNSISASINLDLGAGYLYKAQPVVKNGGIIVSNETISSATTLTAPLTIGSGSTLTINSPYTANNQLISIAVVTNGGTDVWGNLVLGSQGSITNSNIETSLIASKDNNHPKLVWGVPNPSSISSYKIYRKKETADFVEIATVTGVNSYVDNNVNIAYLPEANETAAQYKIRLASNTSYSNTVTYSRVQGSGESKLVAEKKKEENKIFSSSNYPNPFNPTTTISYQIPSAEKVTLKIFDVLGKEIITLVDGYKEAGSYHAVFDASQLPSGVYIYRLEAGSFVESKKMILAK